MILQEGENLLEVTMIERLGPHLQSSGDTNFDIRVRFGEFAGHSTAWVAQEQLSAFVEELRRLDTHRRGFAELTGMSPGAFRLRFMVTDSAGHTAAEGHIERYTYASDVLLFRQYLEFGFSFCPSQLPNLLAEFVDCVQYEG